MKTVASHKLSAFWWILILQFCVQASGFSQSVLNYQGRVISGGTAFNGTGQFKFAIVSSDGSTFYWKNDGTTTAEAPATAVSLPVNKGLFSVQLGDSAIVNMGTINSTALSNTGLKLRVWFNDGLKGFQQFATDTKFMLPSGSAPVSQPQINLDLASQFFASLLSPKFSDNTRYPGDSMWNQSITCPTDFTLELYVDGNLYATGSWGSVNSFAKSGPQLCINTGNGNGVLRYCELWLDPRTKAPAVVGKKIKWRAFNAYGEAISEEFQY